MNLSLLFKVRVSCKPLYVLYLIKLIYPFLHVKHNILIDLRNLEANLTNTWHKIVTVGGWWDDVGRRLFGALECTTWTFLSRDSSATPLVQLGVDPEQPRSVNIILTAGYGIDVAGVKALLATILASTHIGK